MSPCAWRCWASDRAISRAVALLYPATAPIPIPSASRLRRPLPHRPLPQARAASIAEPNAPTCRAPGWRRPARAARAPPAGAAAAAARRSPPPCLWGLTPVLPTPGPPGPSARHSPLLCSSPALLLSFRQPAAHQPVTTIVAPSQRRQPLPLRLPPQPSLPPLPPCSSSSQCPSSLSAPRTAVYPPAAPSVPHSSLTARVSGGHLWRRPAHLDGEVLTTHSPTLCTSPVAQARPPRW